MANSHPALGPWALVTGASDGIGEATARALAATGFHVVLVARREERLRTLAAEISAKHGTRAETLALDLSSGESIDALLKGLADRQIAVSDIGVAVLAAGFGSTGSFIETDLQTEVNMIDVNCAAIVRLAHVFGQSMVARGKGQLVLFGSIVGFQGNATSVTYAATKSFVQSFAEGLRVELRPKGVQVLSVAPGPVATGFAVRAQMKMGMADTPERVARGIIAALGRGGTIRPGFFSKLLGWNLALAPRFLRVRILSAIMAGMAADKRA